MRLRRAAKITPPVVYATGPVVYATGPVVYATGPVVYATGPVVYATGPVVYAICPPNQPTRLPTCVFEDLWFFIVFNESSRKLFETSGILLKVEI